MITSNWCTFVYREYSGLPSQNLRPTCLKRLRAERLSFITAVINDNLSARNLFRQVGRRFWDGRPEYSLYTNVHQLEVIIKDKDFFAHLNIEFMLFDNKGDSVAVAHKANRELRLPEKSLNLMAKSISEILAEELNILSSKIEQQLENQ